MDPAIQLGMRCIIERTTLPPWSPAFRENDHSPVYYYGTIRYCGPFAKGIHNAGHWCLGLELDDPLGMHNGT